MLWVRSALVLAVLAFFPALIEQFESPKIAALRVCGFGALAWVIASGALRRVRLVPLDLAVGAWLAIEILATGYSVVPRLSLLGEPLQREGLLTSIALVGLYVAARVSHPRAPDIRRSRDLFLAAAAIACIYGLIQAAVLDPVPWGRVAEFGGVVRPFGTLGHPNLLGVVAAAAAALALAALAAEPERRWVYGPAAILSIAAVVLSFSRGAWVACVAGLVAVAAVAWRELRGVLTGASRPSRSSAGAPAAAPGARLDAARVGAGLAMVAAAVAAIAFTGWGRMLASRFEMLLHPAAGGSGARLEIWRAALAAWRDRPLLGHGPDTFALVYPHFQTAEYWRREWGALPAQAHNVYLHVLSTRGAIGLLAMVALGFAMLPLLARALRDPAHRLLAVGLGGGAIAIATAGVFGAVGINGALLAFTCGAWIANLAAAEPAPAPAPARGHGAALAWGVAVAALVVVAEGRELLTSRRVAEARAYAQSAPALAESASREAWAMRPFDTSVARARVEVMLARPDADPTTLLAAEAIARAAVRLEPTRAECEHLLAGVFAMQALRREAPPDSMVAHYELAFALAPMDALMRMECARYALLLGRPNTAAACAMDAAALYPDEAAAWALVARARAAERDLDGAREALRRARAGEWRGDEVGRARVEQGWAIVQAADSAQARARR